MLVGPLQFACLFLFFFLFLATGQWGFYYRARQLSKSSTATIPVLCLEATTSHEPQTQISVTTTKILSPRFDPPLDWNPPSKTNKQHIIDFFQSNPLYQHSRPLST